MLIATGRGECHRAVRLRANLRMMICAKPPRTFTKVSAERFKLLPQGNKTFIS